MATGTDISTYRKFSPKMVTAVVRLAKKGLPKKHIAAKVGIHVTTLRDWLDPIRKPGDDYEEFRIKFQKARAEHQERLLGGIEAAADDPRNWKAGAWILERLYPLEYSERKEITHKAQPQGMTQEQFNALPPEDQERYLAAARVMHTLMITSGDED